MDQRIHSICSTIITDKNKNKQFYTKTLIDRMKHIYLKVLVPLKFRFSKLILMRVSERFRFTPFKGFRFQNRLFSERFQCLKYLISSFPAVVDSCLF